MSEVPKVVANMSPESRLDRASTYNINSILALIHGVAEVTVGISVLKTASIFPPSLRIGIRAAVTPLIINGLKELAHGTRDAIRAGTTWSNAILDLPDVKETEIRRRKVV